VPGFPATLHVFFPKLQTTLPVWHISFSAEAGVGDRTTVPNDTVAAIDAAKAVAETAEPNSLNILILD
jgi:hypothetical protein